MPPLENARHERFAQGLAKGKTQEEAYIEAGYVGDRTAASRLASDVNIRQRLQELQERAAIKVELTLADIIAEIEQARIAALAAETVQASAAVSASKAKAELLGLGAAKKFELGGADGGPMQVQVIERKIVRANVTQTDD